MSRTVQFPIVATMTTSAIAACAAVGVVFLVPSPGWRELAGVVVPIVALLFASVLFSLEKDLIERGTNYGKATAQIDPLSDLPSEPVAEQLLALQFAAAERGRELTVVMCRFNDFRRFGALNGSAAADRLLMLAGRVFKRRTRGMNLSARYDYNGTFMTVISGPVTGARVFAQRVQKDLTALEVAGQPQVVSVGIAAFEPGMSSPLQLVIAAEKALQASAESGRIVVAGECERPAALLQH